MRDVDPTEQAVPVAVVGLAAVEMVQRRRSLRTLGHGRDLARRPQHLLVEVVDLPVLDLEVAPEPAAQPACLGLVPGHGVVEQPREHDGLVRRQRPLAHLGVRGGRDVDAPDRRLAFQPLRWGDGRQPVRVGLECLEEPLHPAPLTPAVLVRRGPGAELLAVVAHHAHALAVLGRVVAEVADHVLHGPERDPVAEALLGAEDGEEVALVLGRVRAPQVRLGDGGGAEVLVVEDGPAVARLRQRRRQVRLPDAFREPGTLGPAAREAVDRGCHAGQLVDPVLLRQGGEDRLVQAAAQELDLVARDEHPQAGQELGALRGQPLEQRAGVVQREADARVTLESLEQRQVGAVVDLGEHPSEVAHGLVIVDRQGEGDSGSHGAVLCLCCGQRRARVATWAWWCAARRPGSRPAGTGAPRTRGACAWSRSARWRWRWSCASAAPTGRGSRRRRARNRPG